MGYGADQSVAGTPATRDSYEARYRSLFNAIDGGLCVAEIILDGAGVPVDYRFIEANEAFEEHTGLVNAVGNTARDLVPNLEPHWWETYGQVALTGQPVRFESGSDAMGRWFEVHSFPIGLPQELHVAIHFRDVTRARRMAQERDGLLRALELERSRLEYVFQRAPTFLAVLRGRDYVFEFVNEAYHRLVGREDLVGRRMLDALPEIRDQGFLTILDRVLDTGEPFVGREYAVKLVRTPGAAPEQRFADFTYLPFIESDGRAAGVIAHGYDVTEQVLARREVERLLHESELARAEAEAARADAEAANRVKSEFLAVMSHELRTPLNAIGGYADLMEMGIRGPVTPQQREDLRRIQHSQRHLLGLINEVLNYAKLETGAVHYDLTTVAVRDAVTAAEALVSPQARAKGLALMLFNCEPALAVRADAEKLRQILVNLLSNAVKFTDRGGRVEIGCGIEGSDVCFRIRDTGIGIPLERQRAIFDPFVQVRADLTRQHEGTGLGLAISRDLARGMGGELTLERTELGQGSTFTLRLPHVGEDEEAGPRS